MKHGIYLLHLEAYEVSVLKDLLANMKLEYDEDNPESMSLPIVELERIRDKINALHDIVSAIMSVRSASERYKMTTGYYAEHE